MHAFNVVRFRTRPGHEQAFIDGHRDARLDQPGFIRGHLVDAGQRTFVFVGEWASFDAIIAARPAMIAMLDQFREHLEDLGGGLGVTDPVSGTAVAEIAAGR